MPRTIWSELNPIQLGKYAEYYAKMEFTSYGYDVYTSEVDDHGVDFVIKDSAGMFYEVQVKSVCKSKYVFIQQNKIVLDDKHLVCLLCFKDGELPDIYIVPATAWLSPNDALVVRNYSKPGQKSKPEYGINITKKALPLLEPYRADHFF